MEYLHGAKISREISGTQGLVDSSAPVIGIIGTAAKGDTNYPYLINGNIGKAEEIFGQTGTIINAIRGVFAQINARIIAIRVDGTTEPDQIANMLKDTENGKRAGIQVFLNAKTIHGVTPKIFIAPHFTSFKDGNNSKLVVDKLVSVAVKLFGKVIVDAPDDTKEKAKEYLKTLQASELIYYCYPWLKTAPTGTEEKQLQIEKLKEVLAQENKYVNVLTDTNNKETNLQNEQEINLKIKEGNRATAKAKYDADSNEENKKALDEAESILVKTNRELEETKKRIDVNKKALDIKNGMVKEIEDNLETVKIELNAIIAKAVEPMSAYVAGLMAKVETNEGNWVSPSNHEILGTLGASKDIEWTIGDPTCEANDLNGNNITTLINYNGLRLWGNRTNAGEKRYKFITTVNICNAIDETVLNSTMDYLDKPVNKDFFTKIKDDVNAFLRLKASQGALLGGKCWVDTSVNTPQTIMDGQITIDYDFTEVGTAETLTFRRYLTTKYAEEALK